MDGQIFSAIEEQDLDRLAALLAAGADPNAARPADEVRPILRFSEVPAVEVVLCNHPNEAPMGAGEAAHGPVADIPNAHTIRAKRYPGAPNAREQADSRR